MVGRASAEVADPVQQPFFLRCKRGDVADALLCLSGRNRDVESLKRLGTHHPDRRTRRKRHQACLDSGRVEKPTQVGRQERLGPNQQHRAREDRGADPLPDKCCPVGTPPRPEDDVAGTKEVARFHGGEADPCCPLGVQQIRIVDVLHLDHEHVTRRIGLQPRTEGVTHLDVGDLGKKHLQKPV